MLLEIKKSVHYLKKIVKEESAEVRSMPFHLVNFNAIILPTAN